MLASILQYTQFHTCCLNICRLLSVYLLIQFNGLNVFVGLQSCDGILVK